MTILRLIWIIFLQTHKFTCFSISTFFFIVSKDFRFSIAYQKHTITQSKALTINSIHKHWLLKLEVCWRPGQILQYDWLPAHAYSWGCVWHVYIFMYPGLESYRRKLPPFIHFFWTFELVLEFCEVFFRFSDFFQFYSDGYD